MANTPAPHQQAGMSRLLDRLRRAGTPGTYGFLDRLDLKTPLERARLARLGVWLLLVVLALSAVAALFTAAHAVRLAARPQSAGSDASAVGPAGWAQSYVTTFVTAGAGTEDRLERYLATPPALEGKPDVVRAARTTVVGVRQVGPRYWSITVAADLTASAPRGRSAVLGTRFFQVGVANTADGYTATSLPAVVAGPAPASMPPLQYNGTPLATTDPTAAMVARFLDAYLTGRGELARYLAPGTRLAAISPPPFAKATVLSLTPASPPRPNGDGDPPPISAVLAEVRVTDPGGRMQHLTYALRVAVRDGQWVVTALEPAPLLADEPKEGGRS